MDASDTTKKRKNIAIYKDQYAKLVAANPTGDCANLASCQSTSRCNKTFSSYENKASFFDGRNACGKCNCA